MYRITRACTLPAQSLLFARVQLSEEESPLVPSAVHPLGLGLAIGAAGAALAGATLATPVGTSAATAPETFIAFTLLLAGGSDPSLVLS